MERAAHCRYEELKAHLSPPARRVIVELIDANCPPPEVLRRLVREEGCDDEEAYGYVREVLYQSTMEMTDSEAVLPPALR